LLGGNTEKVYVACGSRLIVFHSGLNIKGKTYTDLRQLSNIKGKDGKRVKEQGD